MTTRSEIHRRVLEPLTFASLSFKINSLARPWLRNRSQPRSSCVLNETIPSRSKQRELVGTDLRAVGECESYSDGRKDGDGWTRPLWAEFKSTKYPQLTKMSMEKRTLRQKQTTNEMKRWRRNNPIDQFQSKKAPPTLNLGITFT